jgi:hypothetical protein
VYRPGHQPRCATLDHGIDGALQRLQHVGCVVRIKPAGPRSGLQRHRHASNCPAGSDPGRAAGVDLDVQADPFGGFGQHFGVGDDDDAGIAGGDSDGQFGPDAGGLAGRQQQRRIFLPRGRIRRLAQSITST